MSGSVSLLDDLRLVGQISQLERRTTRTGRDSIDHMSGASDDLCNAALGALVHVPSTRRLEPQRQASADPRQRRPRLCKITNAFQERTNSMSHMSLLVKSRIALTGTGGSRLKAAGPR